MTEDLIFKSNCGIASAKKYFVNKQYVYKCTSGKLDIAELKKIIMFSNTVVLCNSFKLPVCFDMGVVEPINKLSYIIFEYICYYLIKIKKYKCYVNIQFEKGITTFAADKSPLMLLKNRNGGEEYIKRFEKNTTMRTFRRILKAEEHGTDASSRITTGIEMILEHLSVEKECIDDISEIIGELLDNACEHGRADCLIDIDLTEDHVKEEQDGLYYGINIVIFNFSKTLIGEDIEKILKCGEKLNDKYLKLECAWHNHSKFWDSNYNEKDFFIMSAFQNRISGRSVNYRTGGTGLTKLIAGLEKRSDAYDGFVLSGNRKLTFVHDFLELDEEEWVGFNKENNFVNNRPEKSIFSTVNMHFPGTAYNLNFVYKKGV